MSVSSGGIDDFCGFNLNASTFKWRYMIDATTGAFTPCWELLLVSAISVPLLFFTIISMCMITRGFPRFEQRSIFYIFTYRIFFCVSALIVLILSFVLSFATDLYKLKAPQLIEYSLMFVVWTVYCIMYIASLACKSWTSSRPLNIALFFASKAYVVITTQRWVAYGFWDPRCFLFVALIPLLFTYGVTKFIEHRIKKNVNSMQPMEEEYVHLAPDADEEASWLSRLFFVWTYPLLRKGARLQLNNISDVFELPPSLHVESIEKSLVESSPSFFSDGEHFSIRRALLRTFGVLFFSLGLLRLLSDLTTFAGPILLHLLVNTLEDPQPNGWSWLYAGGMAGATFISAAFSAHFNFQVQKMSLRVRAATVTSIYDKLMKVPLSQLGANSTGRIMNYVSTDVDRIVNFCNSFHAFWSLPAQLAIALFLLYREVGLAFLAGLVAAIVLIPINKCITSAIGRRSEKMMACKDHRVKLITEAMSGIRVVKLSAWEDFFEERIGQLRKAELVHLKARKYLDAVCVYLWASAPLLITVSILSSYTLILHETLTAAKVFTSLALVNILIMPLNAFPWVLNGMVEAFVSLRRLDVFFKLKDIDYSHLYTLSQNEAQLLQVEKASFSWLKGEEKKKAVDNISFIGLKGSIVGVGGPVGSGKSSLLLGLLGETDVEAKKMGLRQETLKGGIAYVGQQCYLSRGSVRENIVWGEEYNSALYDRVIHAACLERDIKAMPGGDEYEISENGATLSGGQRVRVMLARALYQQNSVYLLDDPFASLDKSVADHIWKEAVQGMLRANNSLVVVATHDTTLLEKADRVILLEAGGRVHKQGTPDEVFGENLEETKSTGEAKEGQFVDEDLPLLEYVVPVEEEKMEGAVRMSVYGWYGRATGVYLVTAIIASIMGMQLFKNSADWWLTRWTNGAAGNGSDANSVHELLMGDRNTSPILTDEEFDRSVYFLTVYSIIAVANTVLTLARAFLFAKGGIVAASALHKRLLHKLLLAPLSWWDRTPAGRVINRMCADVYTVDDNLPFQMNIFLASFFNLLGALVITLVGLPTIIPLIVMLFVIYYFIQHYYRFTTVELKRLSTLSLSPLYSVLSDSVNGLATIRSHRFVEKMAAKVRKHLTGVIRTHYSSLAASQWLTVHLSGIAVAVVSFISFAAIVQHRIHFVDSGLVGLSVTYALSMTSLLNGLLGSFIETEKEMVSVERIQEYVDELPEENMEGKKEISEEIEGRVDLSFVSVRYEPHLPRALSGVNLKLEAGQKVAIVGRTGSGKSTLFQALLRACPLDAGRILIDGVDTAKMPLRTVRKIFGIVPQHPFLFSGTLAENLAVDNARADRNTMTHLVRVAQLEGVLERIGGLDGEIEEGGRNLSVGERQIVSLCRLLLTKPKEIEIVLIDEATAHMDDRTRAKVFSLLNTCLPLATLLSIVHRPHSLNDYNLVIRLDSGRIVSCRPPDEEEDLKVLVEMNEEDGEGDDRS